jgi:hypothetical protein
LRGAFSLKKRDYAIIFSQHIYKNVKNLYLRTNKRPEVFAEAITFFSLFALRGAVSAKKVDEVDNVDG